MGKKQGSGVGREAVMGFSANASAANGISGVSPGLFSGVSSLSLNFIAMKIPGIIAYA